MRKKYIEVMVFLQKSTQPADMIRMKVRDDDYFHFLRVNPEFTHIG